MRLDETIAIRAPSGTILPLLEQGAALPAEKRETLSTGRDDQESVRCELVATGRGLRAVGHLEVAVARAPRGVPQTLLVVRADEDGSVHATLEAAHGSASASFSVAVTP
jgi:molecular chaperone DnaK (HSP70)